MADEARRFVLLPRYTSIVGPTSGSLTVYSDPVNVRGYCSARLSGEGIDEFTLQESTDFVTWSDKGALTEGGGQPVTVFDTLDTEWIRLKIVLATNARLTSWVVGEFTVRGQ